MKNSFSYIGFFTLVLFSFYFTDKVSNLAYNKNSLVKQIKEVQSFYNKEPQNAQINFKKNTIIPGLNGRKVSITESYLNMSDFKSFNDNYLIYNTIKPKKSVYDNKDKFIISGNKSKRFVSIIVDNNEKIISLLNKNNITYSCICTDNNCCKNMINAAYDKTNFKLLNRYVNNNRFCLKGYSNIGLCKKYNYYLLLTDVILRNYNFNEVKSKITNGSIILITPDVDLEKSLLLINELQYRDLNIVSLKKLISERD